ncbi:hypothetical protein BDZ97DRAFT_1915489 [Flammula alnicola]|nr:hypothetical protein BDZ97DRAFT_1915489 [Flammula alnicola]
MTSTTGRRLLRYDNEEEWQQQQSPLPPWYDDDHSSAVAAASIQRGQPPCHLQAERGDDAVRRLFLRSLFVLAATHRRPWAFSDQAPPTTSVAPKTSAAAIMVPQHNTTRIGASTKTTPPRQAGATTQGARWA